MNRCECQEGMRRREDGAIAFRHRRKDFEYYIEKCARCLEVEAVAREAVRSLQWCLDNLGGGIEWGGPFDDDHQQGVCHCTHCDARWKPGAEDDGLPEHKTSCPLTMIGPLLARAEKVFGK